MRGSLLILLITFTLALARCPVRRSNCKPTPSKFMVTKEKYEDKPSIDSINKVEPRVNITTNIGLRNYINNINEIDVPIVVNTKNINNIRYSPSKVPNTGKTATIIISNSAPNQNRCAEQKCEGCPAPCSTQQQPCCNMFNYQQPCNPGCKYPESSSYQTQPYQTSIINEQYPRSFYPGAQTIPAPELADASYLQSGYQPGSFYPGAQTVPAVGEYNFRK